MSLSVGARLGQYEILAPLGAGGMGEVYRARDTKLKRDVALKVLPDAFAGNPERMARFQREAEVLASLNHPNIAHVYGVEDRALVMELVEGVEPKGPMPFDEAWKIAMQVADALEYAHERGVIHRDLKPANVKVTPDGVVKLLDFGLAKAFSAEPGESQDSPRLADSPTLTMGATVAGVILGTAAYMAPEQASGKRVDKRADIWSWGVLLYELLTGERLFEGEDAAETLAAVIQKQPDLERVPAKVRRLLGECLQKDPKLRLRDIGDAKRLLVEQEAGAPSRQSWRWILAIAVGLALISAAIVLAFVVFRAQPHDEDALNLSVALPPNSIPHFVALSPDGRRLVVSLSGVSGGLYPLFLRSMDSSEYRLLPGTDGARMPFWSPDSRFIGFFADGKLKTMPASGGPPTVLCSETGTGRGGTWNKNGIILFAPDSGKLRRVKGSGGECSTVPVEDDGVIRGPEFLPDGNRFFYNTLSGVYLGALDSPKPRKILNDRSGVLYAPPASGQRLAHLLFLRQSALMAQPFDPNKWEPVGDPFAISQQVSFSASPPQLGASLASTGMLVYVTDVRVEKQLTWLDRSGKELGKVGRPGNLLGVAISPNGNTVAFDRNDRPIPNTVWFFDITRGSEGRFASVDNPRQAPVWSPDGNRIAYGDRRTLFVRDASGGGPEEILLSAGANPRAVSDWSRDGKFLIYTENDPKTQGDIWYLPDPGKPGGKPVKFAATDAIESEGQLSPDGRWLAYLSDHGEQPDIVVRPFPAGPGLWKVSVNAGGEPRWSRDGKELFYIQGIAGKVALLAVAVKQDRGSIEFGAPEKLFEFQASLLFPTSNEFSYSPHPDGKRFLVAVQEPANPAINVITNWRKLLPASAQ